MYAIKPNGVGNLVGFRKIKQGTPLGEGETFTVANDPKGYVLAANEVSIELPAAIDVARDEQNALVAVWLGRKRTAGILVNGTIQLPTDLFNTTKIQGILLAVERGETYPANGVPFFLLDGTKVKLTLAQCDVALVEQVRHYIACDNVANDLLDDIANAPTAAAVNAIDVPGASWPPTIN